MQNKSINEWGRADFNAEAEHTAYKMFGRYRIAAHAVAAAEERAQMYRYRSAQQRYWLAVRDWIKRLQRHSAGGSRYVGGLAGWLRQ